MSKELERSSPTKTRWRKPPKYGLGHGGSDRTLSSTQRCKAKPGAAGVDGNGRKVSSAARRRGSAFVLIETTAPAARNDFESEESASARTKVRRSLAASLNRSPPLLALVKIIPIYSGSCRPSQTSRRDNQLHSSSREIILRFAVLAEARPQQRLWPAPSIESRRRIIGQPSRKGFNLHRAGRGGLPAGSFAARTDDFDSIQVEFVSGKRT